MENESQHIGHVSSLRLYLVVGISLLLLTALTVKVSTIHLGPWNAVAALVIATIKGLLVLLFFMHLFYDKKIYMFVASLALVILSLLISLTMADILRRGEIYSNEAGPINPTAKIYMKNPGDTIPATQNQTAPDTTHGP